MNFFKTIRLAQLIAGMIILFFSCGVPKEIRAQSLSLSISPPLLEVMIKPGVTATYTYKLQNLGETSVITVKLAELDLNNNIGGSSTFSKDKWINLVNKDTAFNKPFILASGEEKQLILQLNPPSDINEQDYYRILLFSTTPNPASNTSQSSFSQNLGSILLINVTSTGLPKISAEVLEIKTPQIIDSFGPMDVWVKVKNTGQFFFRPIGNISFSGPIAKGSYQINPNIIMSGQTKLLLTDIGIESEVKSTIAQSKSLHIPGFFLGKYRLEVKFTLGEGNKSVEISKNIYAFPWKATIAAIAIFLIFLTLNKSKKEKAKIDNHLEKNDNKIIPA
ncbi:hypothetical protein A2Y99_05130 [Candidatus Gottesmanbacteria bacterium RBG_13_37_7]|uniref:Uncharacterized protein n=1 Tax=Candidatus Gottesmanbacteria bacterium RBG_13_37_7 TaxID=1798369 RepID=A0A1F5YJR4_9BACT|nr:MAG: hypothetical protein A2Y99_05130 [Candidatus Gottesmanbacteria bacterium RBG_13_37_7]